MKLWENGDNNSTKITERVEKFTVEEDVSMDQILLKYDVLGSVAHATMLQSIGMLSKNELVKLRTMLREIIMLNKKGKFDIQLKDEDVHTKIENFLTDKLGDIGKKIHTGRSRNDQALVNLRLYSKDKIIDLQETMIDVCKTLIAFARKHEKVPMPGYTHMQKAMPSSVALWAMSYVEALLDDLELIKTAYKLNNQNPLGSAAGYGVPLNLDRKLTTRLLGFEKFQNNVLYVQNSRGKIESAIISALATVMLDLSRLSNDLILFSTAEFGFFSIPDEFCTGSSIMPKKRNPDILELIRARANSVFSDYLHVVCIVKDLPSGYSRDLQETKVPLIRSLSSADSCLGMMSLLIKDLKVNQDKLVDAFTPQLFAADKAIELAGKGVPFRDAYKQVQYDFYDVNKAELRDSISSKKYEGTVGNLGIDKVEKDLQKEAERIASDKKGFYDVINNLLG